MTVSERKYERSMKLMKLSVPGLILSYVVVTLEIGVEGLPLAGAVVGLVSTFGVLNGIVVWALWKLFGAEQKQQSSGTPSRSARGSGGGGDVGYLEYQCERCGTVLDDWSINEMGASYTCGECGYPLDDQRAARRKVDEGWAWDEEEGLV